MSKMTNFGSELLAGSKQSVDKSFASSSDAAKWVAAEITAIRELIPGAQMSDDATKLYLARVTETAIAIGPGKFHGVVLHIIDNFTRRPTVADFRKLAGLNHRLDPQQEEVVKAWNLVTKILTAHIGRDGQGNVILQSHLVATDEGKHREEPVPEIPAGVKETVRMMGGWSALYDSWPTYAGQRWSQFLQLYRGEPVTALVKS